MFLEPFQAYLIIKRRAYGHQLLQLFLGHRVPQHHRTKAKISGGPVQLKETGVQERIAAGEGDLPGNPPFSAESIHLSQNIQSLGQGGNRPGGAVIAVAAVEVTGLGQMPLQTEYLGRVELVRHFAAGGKAARITAEGRGRGQNETAPDRLPQRRFDEGLGNSRLAGCDLGGISLHGQFQGRQISGRGRFQVDPATRVLPDGHQFFSGGDRFATPPAGQECGRLRQWHGTTSRVGFTTPGPAWGSEGTAAAATWWYAHSKRAKSGI